VTLDGTRRLPRFNDSTIPAPFGAEQHGGTMFKTTLAAAILLAATAAQAQGNPTETDQVRRAVQVCASCHGAEGRSKERLSPSLAAQKRDYTIRQLKDFRDQARSETDIQAYMWGISALLSDDTVVGLADYYAAQTPRAPKTMNPRLEAAGKRLYEKGLPAKGVRPCTQCHGDSAEGAAGFPRLAGLHADYVFRQLRAFRTPLRPHGVLMRNESQALTEAQLRALSAYVYSL
jgi:cytochrome c553